MNDFKPLTIWTLVFNFFIIVGIGHGIACIGLCEIGLPFSIFSGEAFEKFSFSLTASYEASIVVIALFSLTGNIFLVRSFFIKEKKSLGTKLVGLLFLWIGFFYLTHDFVRDNTAQLSFYMGVSFLICSVILFFKIVKKYWTKTI